MSKFLCLLIVIMILGQSICNPPAITVYTESECVDCNKFIAEQYSKLTSNPNYAQLGSISFVYFGNAKELPDSKVDARKFVCEHGENECLGNKIFKCSEMYDPPSGRYKVCLAQKFLEGSNDWVNNVDKCIPNDRNDHQSHVVVTCARNSHWGGETLHGEATRTGPHSYLPWIMLDGQHSEENQKQIQTDLVGFLCRYNNLVGKVPGCPAQSLNFLE